MYLHNGSLPDLKFVFKTNCKFIIPIPNPLPLGKGLSVGLPPSPRLGLRPKPHFQKHIGLSTVCNPPIFVGGFLYFLVIVLSDGQRTVFADFEQQYLFFLAGIGIYIYEHLSAVRRGAVKFIAIKLVCACGRHYRK